MEPAYEARFCFYLVLCLEIFVRLCLAEGTVKDIESYYHVFHYVFHVMPVFHKCHIREHGLDSAFKMASRH